MSFSIISGSGGEDRVSSWSNYPAINRVKSVNGYYGLAKDAYPAVSSAYAEKAVSSWTVRTAAVNNNWRSVCWATELGLFVAVSQGGSGNRVMTSPDGITWTSRTSAADNQWLSVCWAAELGLFVAVSINGSGNNVMTSSDGINWTLRAAAADNYWQSVCWAAELGLFVAVSWSGSGNRVMTSPDGINWTLRTSAADNSWHSVCWAAELGLFVAVSDAGSGDRVMTSSLVARPPTSYNVFDSPFNRIDSTGNWAIQQVLKSIEINNNSTTPSALGVNLLYINNTSSTAISNFTNGSNGQMLTLVFGNNNTSLTPGSSLKLSSAPAPFLGTTDDTLILINNGTYWLEISRSINQ